MDTLPANEKKEILTARQAFKIINYLNDIPDSANNPELYKLFYTKDNNRVQVSNAGTMIEFCKDKGIFNNLILNEVYRKDKEGVTTDEKKETYIDIGLPGEDGWLIRVSVNTMHRLALDTMRKAENEQKTIEKLIDFIKERKRFIEILDSLENDDIEDKLKDELNEYLLFKLRAGDFLQRKMADWHFNFSQKLTKWLILREDMLVLSAKEPIELRYYDFYYNADEKPRQEDFFTEYAVKFLIDFGLTPQWEWLTETFKIEDKNDKKEERIKKVNKKVKEFHTDIPEGHRLSMVDGQVLVRIKSNEDKPDPKVHDNNKSPKFLIGHKAIKNLLIAYFDRGAEDGGRISGFLSPLLKDLSKINKALKDKAEHKISDLEHIETFQLPRYLKLALGEEISIANESKSTEKVVKRIETIIKEWDKILENPKAMSRNEKNTQILRCYQLFDWKYKFLRKDEYEKMSVYHYSLENRKLDYLIKDFKDRFPKEVQQLLQDSKTIDELLINTIEKVKTELKSWKNRLINGKLQATQKAQKLGLPQPAVKIKDDTLVNWHESFNSLPYCIHPMQILQVYYKAELEKGDFSLSKKVWDSPTYTAGLRMEHYNYKPYLSYLDTNNYTNEQIVLKKVIGMGNAQLAEDALLWKAAKVYMNKTNPAVKNAIDQKLQDAGANALVANLSKAEINIPMALNEAGNVFVKLFFHQLDDILFVESADLLQKATAYLIKRLAAEKKTGIYATGNTAFVIPYNDILEEMVRIYHDALDFAFYLLEWERKIVENLSDNDLGEVNYLSFKNVCKNAGLDAEHEKSLIDLRNKAFHLNIPGDWLYTEKRGDPWLRETLKMVEKIKINYDTNNGTEK